MASSTVVAAFKARLAAEWSTCPVFEENRETEPPADGSAFAYLHFPYARREQISIGTPGANVWREEGAARIVLHVPRDEGTETGREWADTLIMLFLGKDLSGVITGAPDGPATDDGSDAGPYYRLALAIPYEFDFTG